MIVEKKEDPKTDFIELHYIKKEEMYIGLYRGEKKDLEEERFRMRGP